MSEDASAWVFYSSVTLFALAWARLRARLRRRAAADQTATPRGAVSAPGERERGEVTPCWT